ncbi:MAG: hypothetical protein MUF83_11685 [Acidimicrobiales bacterium]|jgi:hypothetical protein|nr:hypothetical protein [Acidimicrobiales bacterium]
MSDSEPSAPAPAPPQDPDEIFVGLLAESWKRYAEMLRATQTDDLLIGAVIASYVNQGWALIDLTSDGATHLVRFHYHGADTRLLVAIKSMSESLTAAKVIGRLADVTVGYGIRVQNFQAVWSAIKSEIKSSIIMSDEPGIITVDGDMTSGYVFAQVDLLLDLDTYVVGGLQVDYAKLGAHLSATVNALHKYLYGRLGN